jgi:hypothetical protein
VQLPSLGVESETVYQTHYGSGKKVGCRWLLVERLRSLKQQDQMGILPNATVVQLQQEGIDTFDSLAVFDKTTTHWAASLLLNLDALQEGYLTLTLERYRAVR